MLSNRHFKSFFVFLVLASFVFANLLVPQAKASFGANLNQSQGQYFSAADSASLSQTGNLTIEMWVKFNTLPSLGQNMGLAGVYGSGGASTQAYLFYFQNTGSDELVFNTSNGTDNDKESKANWTPVVGVWYHLAVTYNTSSGVTFYVNSAALSNSQSFYASSIHDTATDFEIGAYSGGTSNLDANVDDVRLYSTDRSQGDIQQDYQKELTGTESNLVAYWKLDGDLNDSTGNGNTLTNHGSASYTTETPPIPTSGAATSTSSTIKAVKTSTETLSSNSTLQNDSDLTLSLAANTTYTVDGVIFASSTSADPGLQIGFTAPSGSTVAIGYMSDAANLSAGGELFGSGTGSVEIPMKANIPVPVHIMGTVTTSSTGGSFHLQWAQYTSNSNTVGVLTGSYLRVDPQ